VDFLLPSYHSLTGIVRAVSRASTCLEARSRGRRRGYQTVLTAREGRVPLANGDKSKIAWPIGNGVNGGRGPATDSKRCFSGAESASAVNKR
jgi:hypothetical protein